MTSRATSLLYLASLGLFSILYALAYFPGLEYHSGYYGMTYKLLHPESFPSDPYLASTPPAFVAQWPEWLRRLGAPLLTGHPAALSLCTPLVSLAGSLWLDDRFNLIVYWLLVVFSLWGLERLTSLFGLNRLQRLAVIAVVLLDHTFKEHILQLVTSKNYSPTNFVYPLAIWLMYMSLKGGSPRPAIALSALCVLTSMKNGWFPAVAALLLTVRETLRLPWRRIAAIAGLTAATGLAVYVAIHGDNARGAFVFDKAHAMIELGEANPLKEPGVGNIIYVLLVAAGAAVGGSFGSRELSSRIRAICAIALTVFAGGAAYYSYAPDAMKIPFLMALAVNRSTWWPAFLVWVALSAYAVKRIERNAPGGRALGWAILMLLYGAPWFEAQSVRLNPLLVKKLVLVMALAAATGVIAAAWRMAGFGRSGARRPLMRAEVVWLLPFMLATALGFSKILWTRRGDLAFLARHGIVGDNPGAKWLGVNEFFREETGEASTVLPLSTGDYPWRPAAADGVALDASLKTRSGRSSPLGHSIAVYLDYDKQLIDSRLLATQASFYDHWRGCNLEGLRADLDSFGQPDYLVAPDSRLCPVESLGYHEVKRIGSFVILHHGPAPRAGQGRAASEAIREARPLASASP